MARRKQPSGALCMAFLTNKLETAGPTTRFHTFVLRMEYLWLIVSLVPAAPAARWGNRDYHSLRLCEPDGH